MDEESWTDRGDADEARAAFAGWHKDVSGVLDAVEETFIWGLFDRAPLARWSMGRVTLLGDACHPMLPFVGQGAAQAIEDGVTLAACLRKYDDIPEALTRYEALRLPRTAQVRRWRETTRAATICRTALSSSNATPGWRLAAPTGRSRRWDGCSRTTPQTQSKPEILGCRHQPSLSYSGLGKHLHLSANGMVRPCSCPASDKLARGTKTRSTPWLRHHRVRLP